MNNIEDDFKDLEESLGCGSLFLLVFITCIVVVVYNLIF